MDSATLQPLSTYARRDGRRRLCAAEGVLVALRRCSLDEAFLDLVQTARRHNVAPLRLADAVVAIAEGEQLRGLDTHAVTIAEQTWGTLLDTLRTPAGRSAAGPASTN